MSEHSLQALLLNAVFVCTCFNSLLARLGIFCMSSGSCLWCFVDLEALDFKACAVFRSRVGGPDCTWIVWAAGLHPVPGSLLLRDHLPWLGSHDLNCCSAESNTTAVFTPVLPSVPRSSIQVCMEINRIG